MDPQAPPPSPARARVPELVWALGLAVLALAPALRPGFVLHADMVAVPRQVTLPEWWGLGPALPRAVPQDGVVALLTSVVPGSLLQLLGLVGSLTAAGAGAARLLAGERTTVRIAAATAYVWTPYVAERLLLGHWGLLVAYACLPWALVVARDIRSGRRRWWSLAPLLGLGALTPSGGLLVALVVVPAAVVGGRLSGRGRVLTVASAVAVNAPWWVPALLNPAVGGSDPSGAVVFALRPEGRLGPLLTALGTGGAWNSVAVPDSRSTVAAQVGLVLVLGLGALGARRLPALLGRAVLLSLGAASVAGIAWCVVGVGSPDVATWVVGHVPGGGLVRDAQKVLMPWALLLPLAVACGVAQVVNTAVRRSRDVAVGPVVALSLTLLVVLALPDLAFGVGGRLQSTRYPAGWDTVRTAVAESPVVGDVLVLPWSTYRAFDWNAGTPVLDPAPRFLTRTTVVSSDLVVRRDGVLETVPGEDPRARAVGDALRAGSLTSAQLSTWGIGLVVVETDQPGIAAPASLRLDRVALGPEAESAHLELYAVPLPAGPDPWAASAARVVAVVLVDVLVGLGLVTALILAWRQGRPGRWVLLHSQRSSTEE